MQRRHHQGEEETKARAKNGVPLPPDGFSSALLFLEPLFPTVFYPPTFCLPPETEPLSSVCTFFYSYVFRFGLQSVLLFAFLWFVWGQFYKSVLFLVLSDFTGYIKYLLFYICSSPYRMPAGAGFSCACFFYEFLPCAYCRSFGLSLQTAIITCPPQKNSSISQRDTKFALKFVLYVD